MTTKPPGKTLAEKLAQAKARGGKVATPTPAPAKKPPPAQLSLELWPEAMRGVPNAVLRGALFGVSQVRKTYKKRTLIAATDNYEVRFKGETFNQSDLDALSAMLHLAMPHPLGTRVEFSVNSFLRDIGRGISGAEHEKFKETVVRLIGGVVEITSLRDQKTFIGALVSGAYRDESTGRYVVKFNEDMLTLYQTGYTLIDAGQRRALGRNSLSKWLHGFYSSHAKPFDYKLETLQKLCGSTATAKEFKRLLKAALVNLVDVGALVSWEIDPQTDLVAVVRVPSASQLKHLAKVKTKK